MLVRHCVLEAEAGLKQQVREATAVCLVSVHSCFRLLASCCSTAVLSLSLNHEHIKHGSVRQLSISGSSSMVSGGDGHWRWWGQCFRLKGFLEKLTGSSHSERFGCVCVCFAHEHGYPRLNVIPLHWYSFLWHEDKWNWGQGLWNTCHKPHQTQPSTSGTLQNRLSCVVHWSIDL